MNIHGSALSYPVRFDDRGTLATVSDRRRLIAESVKAILETRQGERVMMPDYGIPDYAFAIRGGGFAASIAYFLRQQILKYEPLVSDVQVEDGFIVEDVFIAGMTTDEHSAAVSLEITERGANSPFNLVFPLWELRSA